jgi:hypothetical protein
MVFSAVPVESKKQINRAGKILVHGSTNVDEIVWARDLAERWRASHAYPINTFQANLRNKLRQFPSESIAAQRLKRMPTIIDKLKRHPNMQLTTMQDIGGVRAIVSNVTEVNNLVDAFRESKFAHELVDDKDYILCPRDEDGYRSHHLIYKYRNKLAPSYDDLRLELQIRTKLQHTWATAVETMGTFLGQALKSRQGDQQWIDFFALISAAFAHKENAKPVPRFAKFSKLETYQAVAEAEKRLRALEKMAAFSVAVAEIGKTQRKIWAYHLIVLNSIEKTVQVRPYDRDSFEIAVRDYSRFESEAIGGARIEPVLVSAGPIDKLRKAYPSFFLDINDFVGVVKTIIGTAHRSS